MRQAMCRRFDGSVLSFCPNWGNAGDRGDVGRYEDISGVDSTRFGSL